jgi:hypothetical protein
LLLNERRKRFLFPWQRARRGAALRASYFEMMGGPGSDAGLASPGAVIFTGMRASFLSILQILISAACMTRAAASDLPSGSAKGACATGGAAPVALAYAAAFVDQKEEGKPTLLILSDVKLPVATWTSEFDLMRATGKLPFSGAIFFLDKDGAVFRTDFYWKGRQSSVSGYFKLKLDAKVGKELTGAVASNAGDAKDPKVDATFHATLK